MEDADNICKNYFEIRKEIELFSKNVAKKKEIIVLSKADLFDSEMIDFIKQKIQKELKVKKIFVISTVSNFNIEELKNYLIEKVDTKINKTLQKDENIKIYDLKKIDDPNFYKIIEINDFEFEVK
jgi:GTPase involved in cell partitioning and DNA repair